MSEVVKKLAGQIAKQHLLARNPTGDAGSPFYSASFMAAELFDADCSHIQIAGSDYRAVPRLSTGLAWPPTVGTTLLVVKLGNGLLILGPIVGDPSSSPQLGAGG